MRKSRMLHTVLGLFATAILAACQGEPTSPSLDPSSFAAAKGGASSAAQLCQQGGWSNLYRADGTAFRNAGECISYAAQGGTLATRVTVAFTGIRMIACNSLTWGYELDGVAHDVASNTNYCGTTQLPSLTIQVLSSQTLRVYLRDNTCGYTFLEDGDHGWVTGTNPAEIRINDAGGWCEAPPGVSREFGDGNLYLVKTVS